MLITSQVLFPRTVKVLAHKNELGTIVTLILQMRKTEPKRVKDVSPDHRNFSC